MGYQIIHFIYGHNFINAQRPLQIMFLASIITSLCNPSAAVLYGYEKQAFIYKLGAVMAVFNIILDIILIKPYGALGAAVCYAVTTVIGSTIGTVYTCKIMKLKYPFVSISKILLSTVIMGTVMEIIILQNPELPGFIFSMIAGGAVYLICSLVLGTFEKEDYTLMETVKAAFPGRTKKILENAIGFIEAFKNGGDEPKDKK